MNRNQQYENRECENKKIKFAITKSHKIRETKQENLILRKLYELLDNKNTNLEKSREKLRENVWLLMKNVRHHKKTYVDLYNGSPDLYRTINTDGIIIDCNESYADSLGYSKKEIIGTNMFEHVKNNSIETLEDTFVKWKKEGHVKDIEIWFKRKDGSTFVGLLSATNLYDEDGNIIGSNSVIRDITNIYNTRVKLEEKQLQIEKQLKELKKLDIVKDEFLAMITHELKTPLVPIKSYLDMILSQKFGPINDTQKDKLGIVQSNTEYLLKLVTDLLDTQKIELKQLRLTKGVHDLSKIVNNAVEKMREEIIKKHMSITTNLENNLLCLCDPIRIEQALINLLVNAIKFSPDRNGKISVKLYSENSQGIITVKDNGLGISKDKLEKIFVKFYQVDTSHTREYGGSGLGLSVCKGLIESHGGKIWAESEGTGKGTEVRVFLPLESQDNKNLG